ncbi:serine hydrolase [Muricauda sp. MAR_2010_75]|uniref:serine hydrolase domain-containing protein n=1 Tax=Allomuricauda sp. MAR_2010_75 TaxID=1250232 RepID=UPI0009DF61B4|nr:serine hydrolase domain-containing protein [Muricauda sp. MAR_2010_75]
MKTRLLFLCTILLITVSCSSDPSPSPKENEDTQITFEDLQVSIRNILDNETVLNDVKGISVSVHIPGESVWNGVAGNAIPGTPITVNTKFAIASITKTAIAAVMLQLVEEEKLSLDDPLSNWLPSIENIDPDITVRQLLRHQSGIFDYLANPNTPTSSEFGDTDGWTPLEILETFVDAPVFSAGQNFGYSNTNYIVLGIIIESIEGKTIGQVLRDRLWNPLGLQSFYFLGEEEAPEPLADGWSDMDGDGVKDNIDFLLINQEAQSLRWAAGALVATPNEIAIWAKKLYTTNEVLTSTSQTEMTSFVSFTDGVWTGYGLGVQRFSFQGRTQWGHLGGVRGYRALFVYDVESGAIISLCTNVSAVDIYAIMEDVMAEFVAYSGT